MPAEARLGRADLGKPKAAGPNTTKSAFAALDGRKWGADPLRLPSRLMRAPERFERTTPAGVSSVAQIAWRAIRPLGAPVVLGSRPGYDFLLASSPARCGAKRLDVEAEARRRRAQLMRQRAEHVNAVSVEAASLADVREAERDRGAQGERCGRARPEEERRAMAIGRGACLPAQIGRTRARPQRRRAPSGERERRSTRERVPRRARVDAELREPERPAIGDDERRRREHDAIATRQSLPRTSRDRGEHAGRTARAARRQPRLAPGSSLRAAPRAFVRGL